LPVTRRGIKIDKGFAHGKRIAQERSAAIFLGMTETAAGQ
jgi:hypothetical protein